MSLVNIFKKEEKLKFSEFQHCLFYFLVVREQHTQEIECKATDMAVKDLEIYVKAYERAIMRFNLQPFSNIC